MKKFYILLVVLFIAGCKADMGMTINTDQLTEKNHTLQEALLLIEIPSCNDFEDSRTESRSLINAKKEVLFTFGNSKYIQCYNKKLKSFAEFTVPVSVGKISDTNKNLQQSEIYVFSSDTTFLSVFLTDGLRSKIKNAKENPLISNLKLDLSFNIVVGDKEIGELYVLPSYGSSSLKPMGGLTKVTNLKDGKGNPKIKLSDVASDALLETGIVSVIVHRKFLEDLLQ
ncbi:MAG: DUF7424 family protein [Wohlfahrtiimonas sp.]